jgi:hypothetical protein
MAALTKSPGISTLSSPGYGTVHPVAEYHVTWLRKFGSTESALSYLPFITSAVRSEVWLILEGVEHRRSYQIELSEWLHAQNVFNSTVDVFNRINGVDRLSLTGNLRKDHVRAVTMGGRS